MALNIPQGRAQLYQFLLDLPWIQFDQVVHDISPPKGNVPSNSATPGNRVSALMEWLESPIGPGLEALRTSLANVLHPQ